MARGDGPVTRFGVGMTDEDGWPRARSGRADRDRGRRTLTASEAAALIGVSVATIRGWADQGRLPSHRTVGGHRRFELDELRLWLENRGAPAPESRRLRPAPQEIPACPRLARELNARTEAIIDRVLAGYDPRCPDAPAAAEPALDASPGPALRARRGLRPGERQARRARPAAPSSPACAGGLQGPSGARVLVEHTRVAAAVLVEAEAARSEGVRDGGARPSRPCTR